ncbi:hypothetical protein HF086_006017 [Spodoptera exigua]|uniref:Uncharacterized protein n=1 Tax=Spodoptera exigua TaxID=7107 RepID=A0A922MX93_SPOEX|nr:hypothetical protein HF086_006017 [Spodoptera exigua]
MPQRAALHHHLPAAGLLVQARAQHPAGHRAVQSRAYTSIYITINATASRTTPPPACCWTSGASSCPASCRSPCSPKSCVYIYIYNNQCHSEPHYTTTCLLLDFWCKLVPSILQVTVQSKVVRIHLYI